MDPELSDGYMEEEEEWDREGLLDPAWEKQQKKVSIFLMTVQYFTIINQYYLACSFLSQGVIAVGLTWQFYLFQNCVKSSYLFEHCSEFGCKFLYLCRRPWQTHIWMCEAFGRSLEQTVLQIATHLLTSIAVKLLTHLLDWMKHYSPPVTR